MCPPLFTFDNHNIQHARFASMDFLDNSMQPTAEVPLLAGARRELVRQLWGGASYAKLMTKFHLFHPEIHNIPPKKGLPGFAKTKLILSPQYGLDFDGKYGVLFHSIPRDLLSSILLGTVAYDSHRNKNIGLDPRGPGVYVLGLQVAGRGGKFLNAAEYAILLEDLETYMAVAAKMRAPAGGILTSDEQVFMTAVDHRCGQRKAQDRNKPRFIQDDTAHAHAEMVFASLKKRHEALRLMDPACQAFSVQTPLYVGCAEKIATRWVDYDKTDTKTAYQRVNKFLVLVLSLLHHRKIRAQISKVAAVRIWEKDQLQDAELLVSVLANAYTVQDGFNVQEAGGNNDKLENMPYVVARSHEYVFAEMPYLRENCDKSADEIEKAQALCNTREERLLTQREITGVEDELQRITALREEKEAEGSALREQVQEAIENLQSLRDIQSQGAAWKK
ncbi:hypothetical protein QBC41DRAFT_386617 [Cercophora samala]|uniref:Uncharacterized protein n=1 Tax=Cercophora samala TaxID=330535 RepID=A0AA39YK87_9PEZI|nr:hypothetical protein QBC41DRAFT_386617 [Cercophora samala]